MAVCNPGDKVEWKGIHDLAAKIDSVASRLGATSSYEPLQEVVDMPFKFEETVPFDGGVRFSLTAGTISVSLQYLVSAANSSVRYELDPVLEAMAAAGDLMFLADRDDCMCKTVFKVEVVDGFASLHQIPGAMCGCQSVFVPKAGDQLDSNQSMIRSDLAWNYAQFGGPGGVTWVNHPLCDEDENLGLWFQFQSSDEGAPVVGASREITGRFTWPVRAKYYGRIMEAISQMLACENNGGALRDGAFGETSTMGCSPGLCAVIHSMYDKGRLPLDPGCLKDYCQGMIPWLQLTCGAEACNDKPLVYCNTLASIDTIVNFLSVNLRSNAGGDGCCCNALISPWIGTDEGGGYREPCYLDHEFSSIDIEEECLRFNEGTEEWEECVRSYTLERSAAIVSGPEECFAVVVNDNDECEGEGISCVQVSYEGTPGEVDAASLVAAALAGGGTPVAMQVTFDSSLRATGASVWTGAIVLDLDVPLCPGIISADVILRKWVREFDGIGMVDTIVEQTPIHINVEVNGDRAYFEGFPGYTYVPGTWGGYYDVFLDVNGFSDASGECCD